MPNGIRIVDQISQQADAVISNPQNNEVLTYSSSINKWINRVPTSSIEVSKTFSYDGDGRLSLISDSLGTKSLQYNVDGKLSQIVGTGIYSNKEFVYDLNGNLTQIIIS